MTQTTEEELRRRIAELEEDVADLRRERKELRDIVCKDVPDPPPIDEDELIEMMKNHVPGSGLKALEKLGINPMKRKS